MRRIILLGKVDDDRVGLPDNKVVILVVNQGRDTAVWIVLGVLSSLLLVLSKVEIDALIGETEFSQNKRDLPAIGTALVGVQGELFAVRHRQSRVIKRC